ncbi:multiheme c-type cytochrome [Leptospira sp. 96542]|nr:multiheme c-type cytochrome [Leptospira sp. 96542]
MSKRSLIVSSIIITILSVTFILYQNRTVSLEDRFPGRVWAKPIEQIPDLDGVGAPRAENCGHCHTEIYEEWKRSTHAHALSDIQFQSELTKVTSPKWLCLNCHIPIQNQRETIVVGLRGGDELDPVEIPNPGFDITMQKEGVTCATCHVRVDRKTKKSYVIGSIGDTSPPHPVKIDRHFLQNRCFSCHNETYTLNESLICSFQTGTELKKTSNTKTCNNCHMPEVKRSLVKKELNQKDRRSHIHGFVGGGVPKEFALYKHQISLGYKPGLILKQFVVGKDGILIRLKNETAGHLVTTGDPERFYKVELIGFDDGNAVLFQESKTIGQRWEWSPAAKKIDDNRLEEGASFVWNLEKVDERIKKIQLEVLHVRLKNITSDYMAKNTLPSAYQKKIQNIKELYPHSSIIIKSELIVSTNIRKDAELKTIFQLNELRRGE